MCILFYIVDSWTVNECVPEGRILEWIIQILNLYGWWSYVKECFANWRCMQYAAFTEWYVIFGKFAIKLHIQSSGKGDWFYFCVTTCAICERIIGLTVDAYILSSVKVLQRHHLKSRNNC